MIPNCDTLDRFVDQYLSLITKLLSAKDKNEKPFAMAFVKLLNKNGTTLKDEEHDLCLYKVNMLDS